MSKNKLIKHNIIFNSINYLYRLVKLFFIIIKNKIEIVHIHMSTHAGYWQNALFGFVAKKLNRKVVYHMHGAEFKEFYLENKYKIWIREFLRYADIIIVLSKKWEQYYSTLTNTDIVIMENFIEPIEKSKIRKIKHKYFNILYLARVCKRKGIYDLLKVIKETPRYIHYSIVGPIEDKEAVKKIIQQYNISNRCILKGEVIGKKKYEYYKSSDLFILPTYAEGVPISIIEAMYFGLPIISTKVGGIPDLVKPNNGILVPPGNIRKIKKAILKYYSSKTLRKLHGRNNIIKVTQHYLFRDFQNKLEKLYDKLSNE